MKQRLQGRLGSTGVKNRLGGGVKQRLNNKGRGQQKQGSGFQSRNAAGRSVGVGDVRAKLTNSNKSRIQDARLKLLNNKRSDEVIGTRSAPTRGNLTVQIQTKADSRVKLTGMKKLVKTVTNESRVSTATFRSKRPLATKVQITNDMYKPTVQIANDYLQPTQFAQRHSIQPTVVISNDSFSALRRPVTAPEPRHTVQTTRKNMVQLTTAARDDGRLKPPPQVLKMRRRETQQRAHVTWTERPTVRQAPQQPVRQTPRVQQHFEQFEEPMYVERAAEPRVRLNTAQPTPSSHVTGPLKLAGGVLAQSQSSMSRSTSREESGLSHILSSFSKTSSHKPVDTSTQVTSQDVVSPLQGCKVIVTNLGDSVSEDDVIELFASIGALKRARLLRAGQAEVVFVQRSDALLACRKFHNRELDGIPMQLKVVTPAPKQDSLLSNDESKKIFSTQRSGEQVVLADKTLLTKSLFGPKSRKTNVDFVVKI